ncbi:MAG: MFS transporter [Candidatus Pelagadaptatus aseana]|uniref:MFS transporter n=1 Tax=Candidatus Pelagadaptatus aseana TaxID=3120508 RepID=UPI0039B151C5
MNPIERRAIVSLASLYAFRMLGLFMVLPVLVLYGDAYEASTPLLLGLALGAYGFTQALFQIPFGTLSDRIGRKPVIVMGLLIFALGSVVAALADNIYGLILGRSLQGAGAIAAAIMALVADLTQDDNRTKAMASIGASIGVSFSVALVLGPALAQLGGMQAIFAVTAGLAILGIVIVWRFVPSPIMTAKRHRDTAPVPELVSEVMSYGELQRLNLGVFVLHGALMASFVAMPLVFEQSLGMDRSEHWMVYLPLLLLAFAVMVPFIIVAEKRRKMKSVFVGAVAVLAVSELALSQLLDSRWAFLLALFFFFVAFNLLEATLPSLMSKIAPAGAKGTASGVYSTFQFLGAFAGGVGGGWLLQEFGLEAVFMGAAICLLLWLLVAQNMKHPKHLTSIQVPLSDLNAEQADERFSGLPGVVEVLLIEEEQVAYLKVDPEVFDRTSLSS